MPAKTSFLDLRRLGRGKLLAPAIAVFALWALTRLAFLSWGLPNPVPLEADSPWPGLDYGVREQMSHMGYIYPPLQYMVYSAAFTKRPESEFKSEDALLAARSGRILGMRAIGSLMALAAALAIAFATLKLSSSRLGAAGAGAFSLLAPMPEFQSLCANMNAPYMLWWTLALLFALLPSLKSRRGPWERASDIAAGVCLGLSTATKDQIYSFLLVPAFALLLLKREHGWRRALECAALWSSFALLSWAAVWLLGGGLEPLKRHIAMIAGDGGPKGLTSELFSPSLSGRIELLGASLGDLLRCMDWPLALLLAAAMPALLKDKAENMGGLQSPLYKHATLCLAFAGLAFLSTEIFFLQILRFSEPRFLMGAMPFLCVAGGLALTRLRAAPAPLKAIAGLAVAGMLALTFQTGLSMRNDTRVQLRELMEDEFADGKPGYVAVEGLAESKVFAFDSGKPFEVRKIRDWGLYDFGYSSPRQRSILLEPFFLAALEPRIVVAKGSPGESKSKLLEEAGYGVAGGIYPADGPLYSFFKHSCPSFTVFSKVSETKGLAQLLKEQMLSLDLNAQLLRLQTAMDGRQAERQAALLGPLLKPFKELDLKRNLIEGRTLGFAAYVYERAGRLDDAAGAHFICLTRFDDKAIAQRSFLFFQRNPSFMGRFNLKIQRNPDGSSVFVRERPSSLSPSP